MALAFDVMAIVLTVRLIVRTNLESGLQQLGNSVFERVNGVHNQMGGGHAQLGNAVADHGWQNAAAGGGRRRRTLALLKLLLLLCPGIGFVYKK